MVYPNPGSLIQYIPSHAGAGTNLIPYGTEYAKVRWIERNTIGLYVKKINKRALCLFGEELFEVALDCIQSYKEE